MSVLVFLVDGNIACTFLYGGLIAVWHRLYNPMCDILSRRIEREYGVKILPLTDEELNAFKEKVRKDVWPTLYDKFGEDRLNKIMEDVEG